MFSHLIIVIILAFILLDFQVESFQFHSMKTIRTGLLMSTVNSNLDIISPDLELTPTLKDRIHSKVGKVLSKLGSRVRSAHVVLRILKFPKSGNFSL